MPYHYSGNLTDLELNSEKRDLWRCCLFYVVENKNRDYIHKRDGSKGFCLLKDLYTNCEEFPCDLFQFDNENEDDL